MFLFEPQKTYENLWFSDVFRGVKKKYYGGKGQVGICNGIYQ